jgi:beta-lactamase class D
MARWKSIFSLVLALQICGAQANNWQEVPALAQVFKDANITGTFALYQPSQSTLRGYNYSRANTRFVPASTFKILNTLIGLSEGAVASVDEILPYGGQPQPFAQWQRDMSLREAITMSNVPIYQELARRIGREKMRKAVSQADYGNQAIGRQIDRFWLDGPLKISAIEQSYFLAKLARKTLPFTRDIQQETTNILLVDKGPDWRLFGKSGWQNSPEAGVGWWVGWIEIDREIYSFALNIEAFEPDDAKQRLPLVIASLRALGLMK